MRKKLLAGAGALVAAAVAFLSISTGGGNLVAETQARRRMLSATGDSGSVLSVLSPPGAGYDATNVALYTGSGAAVTVTRASTQTCGQPGQTLTSVSSNQPCVDQGRLLVEPAATNVLLRSAELDNASWSDSGTPVVTANTWDFGFGTTGETLADDDAGVDEQRNQTVASATNGAWTASCYVQSGVTSTMRLGISFAGGATGTGGCTFTDLSTTTQRKSCTMTAVGVVTAVTLVIRPTDATAANTGNIKVGGCQLETGSVATSYIPTAGATASRAAQTTNVAKPAALSAAEGCACLNITPSWTGVNPLSTTARIMDGNAAGTFRFFNVGSGSGNLLFTGASASASVAAAFVAGTPKRYCATWSTVRDSVVVRNVTDGTSGTNTFTAAALGALDASLGIGNVVAGGAPMPGALIDSVVLGSNPDGCR